MNTHLWFTFGNIGNTVFSVGMSAVKNGPLSGTAEYTNGDDRNGVGIKHIVRKSRRQWEYNVRAQSDSNVGSNCNACASHSGVSYSNLGRDREVPLWFPSVLPNQLENKTTLK